MKVTLLKPGHTHAGIECKPGASIDVTPEVASWMADPKRGLIAPLQTTTNPKAATAAKRED